MSTRQRLDRLTARWRARREARRPTVEGRPPADADREALARRAFPYTEMSPERYVALNGDKMPGFTYDEARFADDALDRWLIEVGRLLRARRAGPLR